MVMSEISGEGHRSTELRSSNFRALYLVFVQRFRFAANTRLLLCKPSASIAFLDAPLPLPSGSGSEGSRKKSKTGNYTVRSQPSAHAKL